jgi:aminotransferase
MIKDNLSNRMGDIEFSGIRKVLEKVTTLEKEGKEVIHFEMGRPDFDTPSHIKEAAKKALDEGFVHYTSNYGLYELRELISQKLNSENDCDYNPENIIVTVGANEAIFLAMMATLNPGDEVIIPSPAWLHYAYCARLAGGNPVELPLREENGFYPDIKELKKKINSKTKLIVINTPHNPTGVIYPKELLFEIADLAIKHEIFILSDEIYEKIIFDNLKSFSIASIPGMKELTITVNGFSKIFAMTGWRLGYVAADKELIEPMIKAHQYTVVCNCSFAQKGAIAALEGPQSCIEMMVLEFSRRRDLIAHKINEMGLEFCYPQGAFYIFPRISKYGLSSQQISDYLLEDAGVAVVPGNCFGKNGEGYIRMAFANSFEDIQKGLTKMHKSLEKLMHR